MQANQVVDRLTEEARSGNRAYANIMRQILAERKIALVAELGNVEQNIVRALRVGMGNFEIVQTSQEQILFVRVLGLQIVVVVLTELQTGNNGLLQGCCRTDGQEVMHLFRTVDNLRRGNDITQSPAGNRVRFGERRARQRALPHARQSGKISVLVGCEYDVLIHLVRDNVGVVLLRERRDNLQLLAGEHLAARIGRVAQDDGLRVLTERVLKHICVKVKIRRHERHIDGLCAGQDGIRTVVLVKRGKNDNLVARIGDCHHRSHHRLGAAAGGDDLGVRIDPAAHEIRLLGGQRFAEVLRTPCDRILVIVFVGHLRQTVEQLFRRLEVREALRQIYCVILHGNARHAADDRVGKADGALR